MPSPMVIKEEMIGKFFKSANLFAQLNFYRRMGIPEKNLVRQLGNLQNELDSLFIMLSMKPKVKDLTNFQFIRGKIKGGKMLTIDELFELLIAFGQVLQDIGVYKIEFLKSVAPEDAYREDELLGVQYGPG